MSNVPPTATCPEEEVTTAAPEQGPVHARAGTLVSAAVSSSPSPQLTPDTIRPYACIG
ncbi:MAG TPA: hypothetical protein VJV78_40575 [Polyangiales bacterium]|nr:hypothetical protein [Polyangiales bacterium]